MVLLRSMLFVPGNNSKMVRKAASLEADAIILDLEDAVPLADKGIARDLVTKSIPWLSDQGAQVFVRVNSQSTNLIDQDLEQVIRPGCRGIILPKAETSEDVAHVSGQVDDIEAKHLDQLSDISIIPLIESAAGVLNSLEIAQHRRVVALAFGALDYVRDLGVSLTMERVELSYPRSYLGIVARATDIAAVDTPWFDINDDEGLFRDAVLAQAFGFQGKMVIHPRQLDIVNRVFSPKHEDVEWARKLVGAFGEAQSGGKGVISLEGKMIDEASYRQAKDLLEREEAILAKG